LKDEIRLYYGGSDYLHFGWRNGSLCLATLRPDGFAGYEQETLDNPAVITTVMVSYNGQPIRITADVQDGGFIKVNLLNKNGDLLATAEAVLKTITDGKLIFLGKISSDKVQLQFELSKAKLYSFNLSE